MRRSIKFTNKLLRSPSLKSPQSKKRKTPEKGREDEEEHFLSIIDNPEGSDYPEFLSEYLELHGLVSPKVVSYYSQKVEKILKLSSKSRLQKEFVQDFIKTNEEIIRFSLIWEDTNMADDQDQQSTTGPVPGPSSGTVPNPSTSGQQLPNQSYRPRRTLTFNTTLTRDTIKLNQLVATPEKFNGVSPPARRWLEDYEDASIANGWTEAVTIKYFSTFLTDAALDWYKTSVRDRITPQCRWEFLKGFFETQWIGKKDIAYMWKQLSDLRQRQGEPANIFIPKYRRILNTLMPGMPEVEQIQNIVTKLRPEYVSLVSVKNPQTVDELIVLCLNIELGIKVQTDHRGSEQAQ